MSTHFTAFSRVNPCENLVNFLRKVLTQSLNDVGMPLEKHTRITRTPECKLNAKTLEEKLERERE